MQTKFELYELLIRNGYYLPLFKSTAVSEAYLSGIMDGDIFCPLDSDIRIKNCFSQPTKKVMLSKLSEVAKKSKWNLGFSDDAVPNKEWALRMLSTFKNDDEIFKKDYIAPPIKEKKDEEDVISIPSKFLEGLPAKKDGKRTKRSRLKILRAKKAQKEIQKKAERDLIIGEY